MRNEGDVEGSGKPRGVAVVATALALVMLVVAGISRPNAAHGDQSLAITADQGLWPGFDPAIHDYAIRCTGAPVTVNVSAPDGTAVSVANSQARSGSFSVGVPLSTGQAFSMAVAGSGTSDSYHVRCLPSDFPAYSFESDAPAPYGLFSADLLGKYVAVFDTNGVPVWWLPTSATGVDAQVLSDGTFGFFDQGAGADRIYSLSGQPIRNLVDPGGNTDDHELQLLPNGDYMIDAYVPRCCLDLTPYGGTSSDSVLAGQVEELAPDGHLVWSWNALDAGHLTAADTPQRWYSQAIAGQPPYDTMHLNSIDVQGNLVVISMRHTDAVWGIDRTTGNVLWKLGGTQRAESLSVLGDPFGSYPLGGQHDARILPDGTLTIHDNNTGLQGSPLRATHYAIDPQAHSAQLLGTLSDPQYPSSGCCGSARLMPDGNWLTSWGLNPAIAEYAPDGSRLFRLIRTGTAFSYRAIPVPGAVTIADLRAGMDAQYPRTAGLPPVAMFTASPNPARPNTYVNLDAQASYDLDGEVASYQWDFGDGSSGSGATAAHDYSRAGQYLVRLMVTDNTGAAMTVSQTVNVVIHDEQPPIAAFTLPNEPVHPGQPVGFDATASREPGATVVGYVWRFGDGRSGSGPLVSHTFTRPGTYYVSLTVTGNSGRTSTLSRRLTVGAVPQSHITVSPRKPRKGKRVSFTGHVRDPKARILSWTWNFGDHARARGASVRHAFARTGTFRVTLTVRDNHGVSTTVSVAVRVG